MKFKTLLAGLALICGQAFAAPYTWTDTINPSNDIRVGGPFNADELQLTFDITDGLNGFRTGIDSISGYTVSVNLYDDGGPQDGNEKAQISVLSNIVFIFPFFDSNFYNNVNGSESAPFTNFAKALLDDTGHLTIWITAVDGDFMFGNATLTATGNRVPEPSSMLLMGAALLATTLAARRKQ